MFAVPSRARTMLALGILTAASAALWGVALWGNLGGQGAPDDRAGAITLSVITGLAACTARAGAQRERLRKAYEADRDLYTLALKARISPRGGDGDQAPRQAERPAWVRYYPSEPAA